MLFIRTTQTFALGALFLTLSNPFVCQASGESSGGGDGRASHIEAIGSQVQNALTMACVSLPNVTLSPACAYLERYKNATSKVSGGRGITPNSDLIGSDGRPRPLGNDGVSNINYRPNEWDQMVRVAGYESLRIRGVTHEYNVIGGNESQDHYTATNAMVALLISKNFDLSALAADPNRRGYTKAEYLAMDAGALVAIAKGDGVGVCKVLYSTWVEEGVSDSIFNSPSYTHNVYDVQVSGQSAQKFDEVRDSKGIAKTGKYLAKLILDGTCQISSN